MMNEVDRQRIASKNLLGEGSLRALFAIPKDWVYGIPVDALWGDLDKLGHVTNSAFWRWCDDVRVQYAMDTGLTVPAPDQPSYVVVKASAEFHAPMSYGERGVMTCRTVRMGRSSLDTEHALWLQGGKAFSASFTIVLANQLTGRSVALPPDVRERIRALEQLLIT